MKKAEIIKALESVNDTEEFVFRTSTDDSKWIENFRAQEVQKAVDETINGKLSAFANHFDEAVYEVTGRRKEGTQKSSEFVKQVVSELKSKADRVTELEEKIKSGKGSEAIAAELESVKNEYKNLKKKHDEAEMRFNNELKGFKVRSVLAQSMAGMTFNESMPEEVRKVYVDTLMNELVSSAELENDRVYFKNPDGTVKKNPANLEALTPAEILAEKLKPILKEGRTASGGGGNAGDPKKPGSITYIKPDHIITKVQLSKDLAEKGLMQGTKEYDEIYRQYAPNLAYE